MISIATGIRMQVKRALTTKDAKVSSGATFYSLRNFGFLYRMDCTLRELMSLIKEVNPDTRQKGTLFAFSTVYPDQRRYILRV